MLNVGKSEKRKKSKEYMTGGETMEEKIRLQAKKDRAKTLAKMKALV